MSTGQWTSQETQIIEKALKESDQLDVIVSVCKQQGLARNTRQIMDKVKNLKKRKAEAEIPLPKVLILFPKFT